MMVARKPVTSRKAIAQGRPECSPLTCMLVCTLFDANRTRDRGCSAHPVFPAPSSIEEQGFLQNSGRFAPRDREVAFAVIARSPCDEAIHLAAHRKNGLLRLRSQ